MLFIEGAGGLMVPVEENFFMLDFIKYFDAKALLVTHGKLGCINETLLSLRVLNDKKLSHLWCINLKDSEKNDFLKTTLPYYKETFKNTIILPGDLETLEAKMINFI
jgi:dethiobiotin synthetase